MTNPHTFHIPVMGIGFTIDTPLKVAPYGITSVLSLGDDWLLERMREFYCKKFNLPFIAITREEKDGRAKRITAYLNLINQLVQNKFNELKSSPFKKGSEISKYFEMLPEYSSLKKEYLMMLDEKNEKIKSEKQEWLRNNIIAGDIEVNIMTKLDKDNYSKDGEKLPQEMNDAHSGLRGFANSNLTSGVVLSAGLNPRLYSYISNFDVFFPDENEQLEKKVILKVSDYRSALVQGKFLAKKGIWVTEYRVESGLNCGGHAFATDGFLMGPILEEFKQHKNELIEQVHSVLNDALEGMGRKKLSKPLKLYVTAQGGIGTNEEHDFLLNYYKIDKVGWGTPFLLVPEAINIDSETFNLLSNANEEDLYLSDISPIGVPFNTVKGNTKDIEKEKKIAAGKPGSPCPSQFLKLYNTEFTDTPICLASRQYQKLKIKEIEDQNLTEEEYQKAYDKVTTKSCLCAGLVMTAYSENDLLKKSDGKGIAVCPGPNMAYFSKKSTLHEMVDHIYGKISLLNDTYRPHMFIKEMGMYIDYLNNSIEETKNNLSVKQKKYLETFIHNLQEGNNYYQNLFNSLKDSFEGTKADILKEIEIVKKTLSSIHTEIENLSVDSVTVN
ncbi:MAG: hypothetical protein H6586_01680 [Flavobacteriales bacterium]|nr:hypothetical protein [Flavobacteriales bacterium]